MNPNQYLRLARPAVVVVTLLSTTFLGAGHAVAAATKISAQVTNSHAGRDRFAPQRTTSRFGSAPAIRRRSRSSTSRRPSSSASVATTSTTSLVTTLEGNDTVTVDDSGGIFTDTELTTIDGGAGNDTLNGGLGSERFIGGPGNDFVRGGRGATSPSSATTTTRSCGIRATATTRRRPERHGHLVFNGANINENIDVSANGGRVRFTRDVAAITMDLNAVETIALQCIGGSDTVTVNDLSGTGVTAVNPDLASSAGTGDGLADNIVVNGTDSGDALSVGGGNGEATATAGGTAVHVTGAEPALDTLHVERPAGNDTITADPAAGSAIESSSTAAPRPTRSRPTAPTAPTSSRWRPTARW